MSELKNNLIQLIEAYADAKKTDNQVLQSMITEKLKGFLESIEVIESQQATLETPE